MAEYNFKEIANEMQTIYQLMDKKASQKQQVAAKYKKELKHYNKSLEMLKQLQDLCKKYGVNYR